MWIWASFPQLRLHLYYHNVAVYVVVVDVVVVVFTCLFSPQREKKDFVVSIHPVMAIAPDLGDNSSGHCQNMSQCIYRKIVSTTTTHQLSFQKQFI
jgi:hypothetical protein